MTSSLHHGISQTNWVCPAAHIVDVPDIGSVVARVCAATVNDNWVELIFYPLSSSSSSSSSSPSPSPTITMTTTAVRCHIQLQRELELTRIL